MKVFTHGVSSDADEDVTLGASFDTALSHLERRYNDGQRYVLHYVTAREAYNLARAAASGALGDPAPYWDQPISRYLADGARVAASAVARVN